MSNEEKNFSKNSINWYPGHMVKAKREIKEKIDLIDIVYEVIDARMPISSRIPLDDLIENKKRIVVVTKYDLCDKLKTDNPFKDLTKVDLYNKSCQALADDENYKVFCVENGRVTEKGNIKSDAESVFAYLFNAPSIVESHTALLDAILETKIYQWLLKQEKEQDTFFEDTPNTQAWRLVQYKKRKK